MIELTENDHQGREDEEVECEVKPDTSTTFIRYTLFLLDRRRIEKRHVLLHEVLRSWDTVP